MGNNNVIGQAYREYPQHEQVNPAVEIYTKEILEKFQKDCTPKSTAPFLKADYDKVRLELIEQEFIDGIGRILTFGAKKYTANNWKKGSDHASIERIMGALMRHMSAYRRGEKTDPESGESHLYHMATNLMFLDYFDRKDDVSGWPDTPDAAETIPC